VRLSLTTLVLTVIIFSACTTDVTRPLNVIPISTQNSKTPTKTITTQPSQTFAPPVVIPTSTTIEITPTAEVNVCSPLEGISRNELPSILANPFKPPRPGMDDGHHGVDFSFWTYKGQSGMKGWQIDSVLTGQVAGILPDKIPYGNAIIIETPLEVLPRNWITALEIQKIAPIQPDSRLFCPIIQNMPVLVDKTESLYLLYAHMNSPTQLQMGQKVICGQKIGEVGTTGLSSNDHLHFEVRVGPGNVQFTKMAHYDNSANFEEMAYYCLWRVSGWFQLIDPERLITIP